MAEEPTQFSDLLAGYGTTTLGEGLHVESVFALLKVRDDEGRAAWSVRSGGARMTREELLGVLDGLITSMRQRLTRAWKRTSAESPPASSVESSTVAFSELLAGLETEGLEERYLIESVFAIIKARRVDGVPVWCARSSEMKLSAEERLGALEGYAATIRQDLAETWKW